MRIVIAAVLVGFIVGPAWAQDGSERAAQEQQIEKYKQSSAAREAECGRLCQRRANHERSRQ